MKCRKFLLVILLTAGAFSLFGISFDGLNLSENQLLFRAEFESQRSLFISRLPGLSIQQLTAYPEKLEVVDGGRSILALGQLGAVSIPSAGGLPSPLPGYPSFATGSVPLKGKTEGFAASADGRWLVYVEPTSPAFGNLFIADMASGEKWLISEKIELPADDFPARWSPDSRIFVYSKGGNLYYFPIIHDFKVIADEKFRHIGPGWINSGVWGSQGEFYYFLGNTIYCVTRTELFTRTIYGDFLSIGAVTGVLPFEFDSTFDRFWISPNSSSILINKMGKNLFLFLLGENQNNNSILPHMTLPSVTEKTGVLWSSSQFPGTEILTVISSFGNEAAVWRYEINGKSAKTITTANIPLSSNCALSPDGTKVVFWGQNGLEIWDYANWRIIQKISGESFLSCAWINNREIAAGSVRFIEGINVSGELTRRKICLAGANEFGFEQSSRGDSRILARVGSEWYVSGGRSPWVSVSNPQMRPVSLSSDYYRVFLETRSSGPFKNIPMIRNIDNVGTVSIVSKHTENKAYNAKRQMRIALCFDLYDDDTGLPQTLAALRRLDIKATFFLNGDFIRRSNQAASAIARAGHETASLFYAPIDLSDTRYTVSSQYIEQGLARNEDEFFRATGRELSLLWHPPFFRSGTSINRAAAYSGYTTVRRDIDPGDWLSREDMLKLHLRDASACEIVEQIIDKKKDGAVVPVRIGLVYGGRSEYLYQRIDLLLDALIRSGCEIVPVSAVIGRTASRATLAVTPAFQETPTPSSPRLSLLSPAPGTVLPIQTAQREPTIFRWETSEEVARSRFLISRNANPAVGRAEVEIPNPGRTVTVNTLAEGLWYWTVEAFTRDGRQIIADGPRQLRVSSVSLLSAPENLQPQRGYRIGAEHLRQQRNIVFSWSSVEGANSYILTIFSRTPSAQNQILQTEPLDRTNFTFNDLRLLSLDGEYLWQVEAVYVNSEKIIERRGQPGESNFALNVPPPRAQTGDPGVLYGF